MTQQRFKVKRGDFVQVMAGKEKGKRGVVSKVFLDQARVLVEGVRTVVRFTRPSQANPNGKIEKNLSIHISNVAIVDPSTDKVSRVGYRFNPEGKKERFFKKSGDVAEIGGK
jgi:large subunit ribosomal protein L24